MNENINLCEILKDCPKGTKFFSYIHGEVEFNSIDPNSSYPIIVEVKAKAGYKRIKTFSIKGIFDKAFNGICTLVPSLEQPDWSKWECPKVKKPKFDPKTLKAFDKVLVKGAKWECRFFNRLEDGYDVKRTPMSIMTSGWGYYRCVPYNDDTKHLVGTKDEAPEFYKYWVD